MKKIVVIAAMASIAMQSQAQPQSNVNLDTYIGAQLATEDLNGTARYVGMGGAMDALGADISTIGSNPAGIGLFRKSQISGSFGAQIQQDGKSFQDGSKTTASFDQFGFVYSGRTGSQSFLNFAFNYHKNRNLNNVLSAAAKAINGSSQNRQTCIKGIRGDLDTYYGESMVDYLYCKAKVTEDGNNMYYIDATDYQFDRAQTGYIGEFDFNLSGNINNRLYLGLTVGVKSVHYDSYTEYSENLVPESGDPNFSFVGISDSHKITGHGYDVKAGAIVRPFEESPFRFGVSISTPTFYKLKSDNLTGIYDKRGGLVDLILSESNNAEFRFNTPWKFGISAGHTIGNNMALGVSYEYADYSTCDMRAITNSGYDGDGYSYDDSDSDPVMKRHTQNTLCGVSNLKAGLEFKPISNLALRLGYNYVSPIYKESGVRDQTLNSPGTYMASTTDYTNWKATNRLTAGIGFTMDKVRLDLAYQYQMRDGDFYPYMRNISASYYETDANGQETGNIATVTNSCEPVKVKDNRHQLLCTLTYTF